MPRQLLLAAGATPVRLTGAWTGEVSREARELLGPADAVALRVLDGVLSGAHDGLTGLVVCNDSMAHLRIFYVLRVLAGRGRFPFHVHLLDTPRGGGQHRNQFVARQYERLANFAANCTMRQAEEADLADAADREARLGQVLDKVKARRRARTLTGAVALSCHLVAAQRSPEEAIIEIEAVLNAGTCPHSSRTALRDRHRPAVPVFMTGSSHPDPTVYQALENAGYLVVGDDHDTGDSSWIGSPAGIAASDGIGPSGDIYWSLAKLHAKRSPAAARSLSSERASHLLKAVEDSGAAGVLALVREFDDGPVWDLPDQRTALMRGGRSLAAVVQVPADGIGEATAALIAQAPVAQAQHREELS